MKITSWRIAQSRHVSSAFSGEGASRYPGRWNHRGVPVVYTAGSLSLAAMEMLVHLDASEVLRRYVSIPVTFDARLCKALRAADLPVDWAEPSIPASTRDMGSGWANHKESAVLAVPSTVVCSETNFLINPSHSDFSKVEIGTASEFRFDPRLLKGL